MENLIFIAGIFLALFIATLVGIHKRNKELGLWVSDIDPLNMNALSEKVSAILQLVDKCDLLQISCDGRTVALSYKKDDNNHFVVSVSGVISGDFTTNKQSFTDLYTIRSVSKKINKFLK